MILPFRPTRRLRRRAGERGFSLIEALITLVIVVELIIAISVLFDVNDRVGRIQVQVADMQQALRVGQQDMARYTRMAGRGGLPHGTNLTNLTGGTALRGLALEVQNNVTGSRIARRVAPTLAASPSALEGTDVLTIRGCFDAPLFQVATNAGAFNPDPNGDGVRTDAVLALQNPSPRGFCQSLQALPNAVNRPLLIVSPLHDRSMDPGLALNNWTFAVGTITAVGTTGTLGADCVTAPSSVSLTLDLDPISNRYRVFNVNTYPATLTDVAWACLLEEHRYYVREEWAIPGDATTALAPRLTRALMDPGQNLPLGGNVDNLSLDVADDIVDLQLALAYDSDYPAAGSGTPGAFDDDADFLGNDDVIFEGATAAARRTDDWLFNDPGDNPAATQWLRHQFVGNVRPIRLEYLRLTTIARTERPDPRYQAPPLDMVEDRDYSTAPSNAFNTGEPRMHRRRLLRTVVDLRNL